MPTSAERKQLVLLGAQPMLVMIRMTFDTSGNAVDFGDHCYRRQYERRTLKSGVVGNGFQGSTRPRFIDE